MIKGNKTVLRTLREADLETYLEIISDLTHTSPYWPAHLTSEAKLRKEFNENGFWKDDEKLLLITDHEGNFMGEIDCFKTSPNIQGLEIGYRIFDPKNMGKGIVTEALLLFSAYLFQSIPAMPRLTLLIRSDNAASIRVAEKCGYKKEGTLKSAWMDNGKTYPLDLFALLRKESPKLKDLIQKQ